MDMIDEALPACRSQPPNQPSRAKFTSFVNAGMVQDTGYSF